MRSRPKIELRVPRVIFPGDEATVELRVEGRSKTPVDLIALTLVGTETVRIGAGKQTQMRSREMFRLRAAVAEKIELDEGPRAYSARFQCPADAPFSYRGAQLSIAYQMHVHIDIPWWPDVKQAFDVPVLPKVVSRPRRSPIARTTAWGALPFVEITLDDQSWAPGDTVSGALALGNTAGKKIKRVEIAFVGQERAILNGTHQREAKRYSLELPRTAVAEGEAVPFRVRVPGDIYPTFASPVGALWWGLEVRVVTAWGSDIVGSVPIVVQCFDRPSSSKGMTHHVGFERWREAWASAGAPYGLRTDPNELSLEGVLHGVGARVHAETRDLALELVGDLQWEAFGIGLEVDRKRLFGGGLDVAEDDAAFRGRFRVQGREVLQVRAALHSQLRRALLAFDGAHVGDDRLVVRARAKTHEAAEVAAFLTRLAPLAAAIVSTAERIPPPAAMAAAAPAWRALAEELSARFVPGGLALRGAVFEGARFEIESVFEEEPGPVRTRVLLTVNPPLAAAFDPDQDEAYLEAPPGTREIVAELRKGEPARRLEVTEGTMTLEIPGPVEDPGTLKPAMTAMLALARKLRGDVAAGPYR